jgi:hypothetical protein
MHLRSTVFRLTGGDNTVVTGYAAGLEYFDSRLPELYPLLRDDDVAIVSADHGCDPTWSGSDHTREHVPVLVYGKHVAPGSLGVRATFADVGQTLARLFGLPPFPDGVLGFPCNQFGAQEPGSEAQIRSFCDTRYGVTFPLFAKIEVNGPATHPLYEFLKSSEPGLYNRTTFVVRLP